MGQNSLKMVNFRTFLKWPGVVPYFFARSYKEMTERVVIFFKIDFVFLNRSECCLIPRNAYNILDALNQHIIFRMH